MERTPREKQEIDTLFEIFWEGYPKKRAKVDAQRAWRRVRPSREQFTAIMIGINRYIGSGEWKDPQFIPYPATFLNQRRWEDEVGKGAHEVETPQPRFCAMCGRTGSWHSNELKHGRPVNHAFVEAIAS